MDPEERIEMLLERIVETCGATGTLLNDNGELKPTDTVQGSGLSDKATVNLVIESECDIIKRLGMPCKLEEGKQYYLLCAKWWKNWKSHVGYEDTPCDESVGKPVAISHSHLFEPNSEKLKKALLEDNGFAGGGDYVITNQAVWDKFVKWYGGGIAISRLAISTKNVISLDIHPLYLKVLRSTDLENAKFLSISKHDTIANLKKLACEQMGVDPDEIRLWDYFQS
jgi:hypothetical protein